MSKEIMMCKELFVKHKGNIATTKDLAEALNTTVKVIQDTIFKHRNSIGKAKRPEPLMFTYSSYTPRPNGKNHYLKKEFIRWFNIERHEIQQ